MLTAKRLQESVAQPQQFGTQRPGADLRFDRGQLDGNDDIAFDLQYPPAGLCRYLCPPLPLLSQVPAIRHDERSPLRKPQCHIDRAAETNGKTDTSRAQSPFGFRKTFKHEGVVPRIGLGIVGRETKADKDGEPQPVGRRDRGFERRIELGPLRVLHPIEDVIAGLFRRIVEFDNTFGLDQRNVSHIRKIPVFA